MRPEDALGALLRAKQAVIVGDEQQLPPTEFFRRASEEAIAEDPELPDEDLESESVLDLALGVMGEPRVLRWHYRSRHESLIAFSNQQFYDGKLVVAPAPRRTGPGIGVSVRQVKAVYEASTNPREADAVVDTVLELMREHPDRSIGVAALNQPQSDLIREKFDERMQETEQAFVERWKGTLEPFFVKNLENVQGDERDAIVVSLTFGPDPSGHVYQRFGPINGINGHRRLNVLFSRAKHQLVVVTSLRVDDVRGGPGSHRGVHVLRGYLEYAAQAAAAPQAVDRPDGSPYHRLSRDLDHLGFDTETNVGSQSLTLDLGVRHPDNPTEFLAGVEVDGGGWMGPARGRDRDGTRPIVLENLGWKVASTWTSDWLREPGGARRQLVASLTRAAREQGRAMPPVRARVVTHALEDLPGFSTLPSVAQVPAVTVEVWAGTRPLGRFTASGGEIRMGRSPRCEIQIPDEYQEVSGVHAKLRWEAGRFVLIDEKSRNGTYLDGRRVTREELTAEAIYKIRLGVGVVSLRFVYGGPLPPAIPPSAPVLASQDAHQVAQPVEDNLGLPAEVAARLGPDERQFLTLLRENGSVRLSELQQVLGKRPGRVAGMAHTLRRMLHDAGIAMFRDEQLPNGEIMFRHDKSGS